MEPILLAPLIAIVAAFFAWRSRDVIVIYQPNVGLLYRDGIFARELPPGRHTFFNPSKRLKVVRISLAELPTPLGELTVLSRDRFSFRLALAPVVKVTDPRIYIESQSAVEGQGLGNLQYFAHSHGALSAITTAAALEVAAARTLQDLLDDQAGLREAVQAKLADAIPGARVERVLLTGINLPPETRKMFTDVERAKMEGQAALERARGEQAALRALSNAARLITDNPALANLRLLQAMESSKGATTIVIGNAGTLAGMGVPADPARPA